MVQSALANADVPFQQIVIDANVPRSASYTPLFQTIFTLEDASFDTSFELDGAAVDGAEARRAEGPCHVIVCWLLRLPKLLRQELTIKLNKCLNRSWACV